MEILKKLGFYLLAGVLAGAPMAWGQSWGDRVLGVAASCTHKIYDQSGLPGNYKIAGKVTAPACKYGGPATVSSSAKIGPPQIGATALTTIGKCKMCGDAGTSEASSTDLAALTPPNGWSGSVPVELKTIYDFGIKGAVSIKAPAKYQINWRVTSGGVTKVNHTVSADFNGAGEQKPSFSFTVDQVNNAYEFTVTVAGESLAAASRFGGPSAHFVTFPISVILPQGWTCAWGSGAGACGN